MRMDRAREIAREVVARIVTQVSEGRMTEEFAKCLKQQSEDDDKLVDEMQERIDTLENQVRHARIVNKRHGTCWENLLSQKRELQEENKKRIVNLEAKVRIAKAIHRDFRRALGDAYCTIELLKGKLLVARSNIKYDERLEAQNKLLRETITNLQEQVEAKERLIEDGHTLNAAELIRALRKRLEVKDDRIEELWEKLQCEQGDRPLALEDLQVGMQVEAWSFIRNMWLPAEVSEVRRGIGEYFPLQVKLTYPSSRISAPVFRYLHRVRLCPDQKDLKLKKERIGCLEMELGMQKRRIEELEGMLKEAERRALRTDFWREPEPKLKLDDLKVGMEVEAWSLEDEKWLPSRVSEIIPAGLYKVRVVQPSSQGGLRNLDEIRLLPKPEPSPNPYVACPVCKGRGYHDHPAENCPPFWDELPCPRCIGAGAILEVVATRQKG